MLTFKILAALATYGQSYLASAHVLPRQAVDKSSGPPPGYTVGFTSQDTEPVGQGSICTTSCPSSSFIQTTSTTIRRGTYSAAINSALGGGSSDCAPCGSCYNIINAGVPHCNPDPYDPSCGGPSGSMVQGGPSNITVMITNHCTDCKSNQIDVNHAPSGWDNPKVYFMKVPDEECR